MHLSCIKDIRHNVLLESKLKGRKHDNLQENIEGNMATYPTLKNLGTRAKPLPSLTNNKIHPVTDYLSFLRKDNFIMQFPDYPNYCMLDQNQT